MDHITAIFTLFKNTEEEHIVHLITITIRKSFHMKTTRPLHVNTFKTIHFCDVHLPKSYSLNIQSIQDVPTLVEIKANVPKHVASQIESI